MVGLFSVFTIAAVFAQFIDYTTAFSVKHVSRKRFLEPIDFDSGLGSETSKKASALHFKSKLRRRTIGSLNSDIVLECEVGGNPTPTIHWLKDGVRIDQSGHHNYEDDEATKEGNEGEAMRLASTKSRLFLDCLSRDHEGVYTCVAETPFLRRTQSTRVKIATSRSVLYPHKRRCMNKKSLRGFPARINMWSVTRLEYEGNKVQLFCRAEGNPRPSIMWYDRDNQPIEDGGQYRMTENGDLVIKDLSWFKNMGLYTCVADNGISSDSADTFVYPTAKDDQFSSLL